MRYDAQQYSADVRKSVASFGPPDALRSYKKWKAANRELLRLVPDASVEIRTSYYGPGGGDGIEVFIDQTYAGLFDERSNAGRQA